MPEENNSIDLQRTLDILEDPTLNKPLLKGQYLNVFLTALNNHTKMSTLIVNRLLAVCVHALEEDKVAIIHVMKIIQSLLKRIEAGDFPDTPNLMPSILAVFKITKTTALLNKLETVQTLCFEILLSYPNEVLIEIATLHPSEVIEVLNLYCHLQIPPEIRMLPCGLISKLLQILPPEKKAIFVKENISTWFSKIIPVIVHYVSLSLTNRTHCKPLETLESLTKEILPIDYSQHPHWVEILECIYNPQKFPAMMIQMLNNNSDKWHRLWIVFIRLLKNQITKHTFSSASPINAMLPVVESAFKMDVTNRCRAFQCWDVLIDNFSMESNESYVAKRLKLLIIPLKSNNAKVEETALAKLKTWWHLIRSYQTRLDRFVDKVIISFLHFCFGRHGGSSPKSSFVPGLINNNTKKKSVEAFIELAGHLSCPGCVNVPALNTRIISKSILVDHWNDWAYSLKKAISILNEDVGITIHQIECLWKSSVMIVADLPDNNIRKDLFYELLNIIDNYLKECEINNNLTYIIFHLAVSLFTEEKIHVMLKPKDQKGPLKKIFMFLLSPSLHTFYRRSDTADIVMRLKPLSNYLLEVESMWISMLVNSCQIQHSIPFLITALAQSVYESNYEDIGELTELMLWPLKATNSFINVEYSTKVWVTLIKYMYPAMKPNIKEKLRVALSQDITQSNMHLKLHLCIAILRYELENDSVAGCTRYVEVMMIIIEKITDHKFVRDNLTLLIDTVVCIINKIKPIAISALLQNTLTITKNLLKMMKPILEETAQTDTATEGLYEKLFKNLEVIAQNDSACSSLTSIIIEELVDLTILYNYPTLKISAINIMNTHLSNSTDGNSGKLDKVKAAVDILTSASSKQESNILGDTNFAAPVTKVTNKKKKKKEMTIVNTVVENGEEFEVIKSNWKFNPGKLTENQKEKLQRKREDIPALYQDLSQSQDEFKLSTWKTDSQDSSSTNSKSTTNSKSASSSNVSEILKHIPSSDVVPKIIENIFSEKKDDNVAVEEKSTNNTCNKLKPTSIKDLKTPRMALKDRVFRNVRNLIEKSDVQKGTKDLSESLIQVENIPKTPTSKTVENMNLVNSAPPNLVTDRPSRMKRKPKKFDDVQIFSLKKSRRSSSLNDSQLDSQLDCQVTSENVKGENSATTSVQGETKCDSKNIVNQNAIMHPVSAEIKNINIDAKETTTKRSLIDNHDDQVELTIENNKPDRAQHINLDITNETIGSEMKNTTFTAIQNSQDDIDKDAKSPAPPLLNEEVNNSSNSKVTEEMPSVEISHKKYEDDLPKDDVSGTDKYDDKIQQNKSRTYKTPKSLKKQETVEQKSGKRNSVKKSRIEKELAIDTVEGHPYLKIQTEKRMTRKNLNNALNNSRRKSLTDKLNKSKVETTTKTPLKTQTNCSKKKENEILSKNDSIIVGDSQEECSEVSYDIPFSEDIIESSQDSTFTAITVKPSKTALKKLKVVVQKVPLAPLVELVPQIQSPHNEPPLNNTMDTDGQDDTELPQNTTAVTNRSDLDLTENMDTQPVDNAAIEEHQNSSDVIILDDVEDPIVIGSETQEIADADTQPTDLSSESQKIAEVDTEPTDLTSETQEIAESDTQPTNPSDYDEIKSLKQIKSAINIAEDDEIQISNITVSNTAEDMTATINESIDISAKPEEENTASSPFKDDEQRKKDFLDNTIEISPIKTMSPARDKKSPSPEQETSSDYVLIKLSSPVQSNGEPFEKCDSPEIFTEDKISPDKRDLSPPRDDNTTVNNSSPNSSLSLKKNRPQVRSGGRAAQMLGLCVPGRLHTIMNSERSESEELKKSSPSSTPARRNLRILYNSVGGDSSENLEENEDSENFLKFKRGLPTTDFSPSGPILKRKLAEIKDDATISPASKKKRVSFHDPPVSTTISVQKYIEPGGIRSPQNSAQKRLERQNLRSQAVLKSPKRLDSVFKLDTVLTKAVESFSETEQSTKDITQSMSLEETPTVEIIRNSDLNDADPIHPDLVNCEDPIEDIAADLSSATMKTMFLKELEGKIATIGDLAKMTELEVNRLCIKAPKVKVAKKVLSDYSSKRGAKEVETIADAKQIMEIKTSEETPVEKMEVEVQTNDIVTSNVETQCVPVSMTASCVQTDETISVHAFVQTNESGAQSSKELISSCLFERPDFVENLCDQLEESSKQQIAETLPINTKTDMFMKNISSANFKALFTQILQKQTGPENSESDLLFLQDYLCDRFNNRDLIMFCSQLLAKIHSKPS